MDNKNSEQYAEFENKGYNVFTTLMVQASLNYAKSEVSLELLVKILAKIEGKETKEIWDHVDERMEIHKVDFMKMHAEEKLE